MLILLLHLNLSLLIGANSYLFISDITKSNYFKVGLKPLWLIVAVFVNLLHDQQWTAIAPKPQHHARIFNPSAL